MPTDSFGRQVNYLRISLTDNCNLRCVYCMPLTGLVGLRNKQLLTPSEIERFARAAARTGFDKIRFTGGEPTLREDILEIVERVGRIEGISDLSMTTNGIRLPGLAAPLREAGLRRFNIHIDSLHKNRISKIMRFASVDAIWNGIEAAVAAGFEPIKLNCVVVRDYNDADVLDLARLTLDRNWHVRFVELMPFGDGECAELSRTQLVTSAETRQQIEYDLGPLTELSNSNLSDESRNYQAAGAIGVIGFISPVSEPYCGTCNRMRLTADGKLHLCLLHDDEIDIREAIRAGRDDEIETALVSAVHHKPIGHDLSGGVHTQLRVMVQIGG
ncbi:MAG: GTP 3',8-cyclase MoaA [Planctomycetes bacterium]|nr:GTP 3',8-cyclase MoaA [Planctomycetota bacterium]MBI3834213.1 GTP 3',8-cyclase MoaA [Planctomycetota bacterium]